jgi:hypothetical protein
MFLRFFDSAVGVRPIYADVQAAANICNIPGPNLLLTLLTPHTCSSQQPEACNHAPPTPPLLTCPHP